MPSLKLNQVKIAYRDEGSASGIPIVLIQGVGQSLVGWPQDMVDEFIDHGFRVIRLDNRDSGRSSKMGGKRPNLVRMSLEKLFGVKPKGAQYQLTDMANDVAALLDELGISRYHLAGISMGGMIAQQLAIEYPARVLSLASLMSTTGELIYSLPSIKLLPFCIKRAPLTKSQRIAEAVNFMRVTGSKKYPTAREELELRAQEGYERGYSRKGMERQLAAIIAAEPRSRYLKDLAIPSLVLHGDSDPLVPLSGGKATARALGVKAVVVPGLGHDLPPKIRLKMVDCIVSHALVARQCNEELAGNEQWAKGL